MLKLSRNKISMFRPTRPVKDKTYIEAILKRPRLDTSVNLSPICLGSRETRIDPKPICLG
jgi:hypothetical protein